MQIHGGQNKTPKSKIKSKSNLQNKDPSRQNKAHMRGDTQMLKQRVKGGMGLFMYKRLIRGEEKGGERDTAEHNQDNTRGK